MLLPPFKSLNIHPVLQPSEVCLDTLQRGRIPLMPLTDYKELQCAERQIRRYPPRPRSTCELPTSVPPPPLPRTSPVTNAVFESRAHSSGAILYVTSERIRCICRKKEFI